MESFFLSDNKCCKGYQAVRDCDKYVEMKKHVEDLWKQYQKYADMHFLKEACLHFQSRYWEMYLGVTLMKQGFDLNQGRAKGPEFHIQIDGDRKVWFEAIAPDRGNGADAVPEPENGVVQAAPLDQWILRLRHAIEEKKRKYDEYRKDNIVGSDDIYIIAINTRNIAFLPYDSDLPSIVKAVYPFGNPCVNVDTSTGSMTRTGHEYSASVQKQSGSGVSTSIFLDNGDNGYQGISAVICSHVDCASRPVDYGGDFVLVRNAEARNKLDLGTFTFGREYWIEREGDTLTLRCQP